MRWRVLIAPAVLFAALVAATPAAAEKLKFDHRLYPQLKAVLDSGDDGMIAYDNANPGRLVSFIAVRGKSAKDWTEAMQIIALLPPKGVPTAQAWMDLLKQQSLALCPASFTLIAQDDNSVTYERRSPGCDKEAAGQGIYRLVAGKRSWFELAILSKTELSETDRAGWLALLASAHLE